MVYSTTLETWHTARYREFESLRLRKNFKPTEIITPAMETKSDSNFFYSKIAKFFDAVQVLSGYKLAVRYFIDLVPFERRQNIKVLDAGCGTGLFSFALLRRFPNASIKAFDLNGDMMQRMIDTAHKKGLDKKIDFLIGDVTKPLPFNPGEFDLIITGGVLEYVDPPEAVKNLTTYLKRGGYFLNSPVQEGLSGQIVGKLYKFKPHSRSQNVGAFTDNSFRLEGIRSFPVIKEAHLFRKL